MTTKQWHDNHYEKTTPETPPQHWRRFIDVDPFNPETRESLKSASSKAPSSSPHEKDPSHQPAPAKK